LTGDDIDEDSGIQREQIVDFRSKKTKNHLSTEILGTYIFFKISPFEIKKKLIENKKKQEAINFSLFF